MATSASRGLLSTMPQELPLEFLKDITNAFSDERKISGGAFGTVYKALRFYGSFNVVVAGITIVNSSQCHLKFDNCQGVMVHDVTISSPENSLNTDGIHLQNSKDVSIHHTNLACGDDCISIQTGCSNINIHNVNCGPGHGISIGGLGRDNTKACVSNVTVRDVNMFRTMNGVRIKTWQDSCSVKEATNLMAVDHENIQKLLGCCSEARKKVVEHKGKYILVDTDECVLCYEYAPRGSLRGYLSDDANRSDWDTSFKIIKGICWGLHFLHQQMGAPIVHLDLQPANILLDDNMVPKIADFGLSRFFGNEQTRINTINVVGAKGYMAPEYLYTGEISPQCDIYSLGVLILEITTREKNCSNDKDMAARNFILDIRETWNDGHIASKYSSLDADRLQQVKACIEIACRFVDVSQKNRPPIVEVVDRVYGRRAG